MSEILRIFISSIFGQDCWLFVSRNAELQDGAQHRIDLFFVLV